MDTNEACKPSQYWILLVGHGSLVWTRLKMVCFYYDLGFRAQQLIPNSQVIINSSLTPCDFPKQTSLNLIVGGRTRAMAMNQGCLFYHDNSHSHQNVMMSRQFDVMTL